MCFNGQMSGAFALLGLSLAWWINSRTSNTKLAAGVFFFFTMEMLQAIQYMFLATDLLSPVCQTAVNQVLTVAGFIHICAQPYFCHLINEALSQAPNPKFTDAHNRKLEKYRAQYAVIKRLAIIGGLLIFARWPMSYVPGWNTQGPAADTSSNTEWIRGHHVCTFKTQSMVHLGWSIPMADATYNIQGIGLHSFLMFAPFFALYEKKGMPVQGLFLYLTGPFAAALITNNLMEQASIWCFFSIAQIAVMLFLIRETLIVTWGSTGRSISSLGKEKSTVEAAKPEGRTPSKSRKVAA